MKQQTRISPRERTIALCQILWNNAGLGSEADCPIQDDVEIPESCTPFEILTHLLGEVQRAKEEEYGKFLSDLDNRPIQLKIAALWSDMRRKWARIDNSLVAGIQPGGKPLSYSIRDSLLDMAIYSLLSLVFFQEEDIFLVDTTLPLS